MINNISKMEEVVVTQRDLRKKAQNTSKVDETLGLYVVCIFTLLPGVMCAFPLCVCVCVVGHRPGAII